MVKSSHEQVTPSARTPEATAASLAGPGFTCREFTSLLLAGKSSGWREDAAAGEGCTLEPAPLKGFIIRPPGPVHFQSAEGLSMVSCPC